VRGRKSKGRTGGGGPAALQLAGGERLGTWRGEKIGGPGSSARCEREG
jgi:hypothetical protein